MLFCKLQQFFVVFLNICYDLLASLPSCHIPIHTLACAKINIATRQSQRFLLFFGCLPWFFYLTLLYLCSYIHWFMQT